MKKIDIARTLAAQSWRTLFDSATLRRGTDYAANQRVFGLSQELVSADGVLLVAQVRGQPRRPYQCLIGIRTEGGQELIGGRCDCPVGINCKHIAAALIVASQMPASSWADASAPASPALGQGPDESAGRAFWRAWLRELGDTDMTGHLAPASQLADGDHAFALFVSDLAAESWNHPGSPGRADGRTAPLYVAPVWLRPGKSKPWVAPRSVLAGPQGPTPAPAEGWPEDVEDALVLLLRDCAQVRHGALTWLRVTTAYQERAVARLARQYLLFADRAERQTLTWVDGLPLALDWQPQDDGSQQLMPRIDGSPTSQLLQGGRLWFLDREGHRFGPVDAAPGLVRALADAPPLPPEEVAEFNRQVADQVLALPLPPAAARGAVRRLENTPPPRLCLSVRRVPIQAKLRSDWSELPDSVGAARIHLDYGGVRVDENDPQWTVRKMHGDDIVQFQRDPAAERRLLDLVHDSGLIDIHLVQDEYGLRRVPFQSGDFLCESYAGYGPARPEEWRPLLARLAGLGVEIIYEGDFPHQRWLDAGDWHADIESSGSAWFDLHLGIDLDGQRVDLLPILRRVLANPAFVLVPNAGSDNDDATATWTVALDAERRVRLPLQRLRELIAPLLEWLEAEPEGNRLRLHRSQAENLTRLADTGPLQWRGSDALRTQLARLRDSATARGELAPGFAGELRGYQREGLAWLDFLAGAGLGGVLADDMGLGKTVQVLAHLLGMKHGGDLQQPALIVCPTSLVGNWRDEAVRFTPTLRCLVLHGADRADRYDEIGEHDLVITTYPLLPRDRERLLGQRFSLLVLDEAQAIKNARSQAAQVVREIPAERRLAMTGTPLENHLGELWAQFDAVEPGLLGSARQFTRLYRTPIEKRGDGDRQQRLNRRIGPLLLRRRKDDVLADLPAKTEIVRSLELAGDQRSLYETLRLSQHERVQQVVAERGLAQAGIVVLDALLKLRQACCDPRLVKLASARKLKTSVKLAALIELVRSLVDEGRRILVFSQFAQMLALIEDAFDTEKIDHQTLTGQTPGSQRAGLVRRFQDGQVPVFLISLKAGGVGLNLTAADTVIHYDPWWNPAVEAQATDRAHRIGQDKPVFVYKLICAGTVEEKIQGLQERKAELARAVLEGGSSQRLRFDEGDLDALFAPM
ncbi:MAG: DEAD/DEAH box helicase [Xanthomonadales bacterium]|nr:DEAD/DEAH box helicase [Xanthomonadales bacterium]